MVSFWTVATVMVVLATTAVVAPMFWLRSADERGFTRRRLWSAAAIVALLPLAALGLYAWLGSPWLAGAAPAAATDGAATAHPGETTGGAAGGAPVVRASDGASAGDLGAAITRLEARLASQPDDPPSWELLAQSYEFQGRTQDAAGARQRRLPQGGNPGAASGVAADAGTGAPATGGATAAPLDSATLAAVAARLPSGSDGLAQQAQQARRARDFPRAIAAFRKLASQGGLDAGLWADYADATAAQRGALDEVSEPMIRQALALEPGHPKALWLLGSLQVQRRDFAAALQTWQRLQAVMPAGSSDARLIEENMAEARAMLGAGAKPAAVAPAAVRGEIDLDARWRGKVPAQTVLYVFAKAVGQPGPPVAVLRTTAATWPLPFALDDSLAMMPGRNLSSARSVVVEARLSRSGSANPQPGDLRGTSAALDPRQAGRLRIVIAEEVR